MEPEGLPPEEVKAMVERMSEEEVKELDKRAQSGETLVRGGTGGLSVAAQLRLAEGRSRGGHARAHESAREGSQESAGRKGRGAAASDGTNSVEQRRGAHRHWRRPGANACPRAKQRQDSEHL